jgi:hypothetical protein
MATSTIAMQQQLLTKADWPEWYSSVSRRAERDDIWEYCNSELLEEGSTIASLAASVHQELIEPIRPTANLVEASATQLSDLVGDDLTK